MSAAVHRELELAGAAGAAVDRDGVHAAIWAREAVEARVAEWSP